MGKISTSKTSRIAVQITLTPQQERIVQLCVLAGVSKSKAAYCLRAVEISLKAENLNELKHKAEALGFKKELEEIGFS